jgi:hypothetical protein
MSSILDFAQTLAIISLQKEHNSQNIEFNPLHLKPNEFLFYTLVHFDIKNPEPTFLLLEKYKLDEDSSTQMNNYLKRAYGSSDSFEYIYNEYNSQRNLIIEDVIVFYQSISEKSNFLLSQYHIDIFEKYADQLIQIEEDFITLEKQILDELENNQNNKSFGCLSLFNIFIIAPLIFLLLGCFYIVIKAILNP